MPACPPAPWLDECGIRAFGPWQLESTERTPSEWNQGHNGRQPQHHQLVNIQQRTIQWKDLTICASLLAASVWFQPALADAGSSCHFYGSKPAGENVVVNCAGLRRDSLSRPASSTPWQAIKHDKAEVVDGRKGKEWKVTFKGAAAKDKSRETLNMFFASNGSFIAANFTGQ